MIILVAVSRNEKLWNWRASRISVWLYVGLRQGWFYGKSKSQKSAIFALLIYLLFIHPYFNNSVISGDFIALNNLITFHKNKLKATSSVKESKNSYRLLNFYIEKESGPCPWVTGNRDYYYYYYKLDGCRRNIRGLRLFILPTYFGSV